MSQNLGNLKFLLRSSLNYRDLEPQKTDLNKENDFYSLINKKRKRYWPNNNYKIRRCPSCASSSLRNFYKHIHENKNGKIMEYEEINQKIKELKYQLENKVISSPKEYLFPQKNINIIKNEGNNKKNILENNIIISKINNNIREQKEPIKDKKPKGENTQKKGFICETKRDNNEIGINYNNNQNIDFNNNEDLKKSNEEEEFFYQNDDLNEDEKNKNNEQNIIECKLVKISAKKKKVVKPKKSKKIILQVEKCFAPQI